MTPCSAISGAACTMGARPFPRNVPPREHAPGAALPCIRRIHGIQHTHSHAHAPGRPRQRAVRNRHRGRLCGRPRRRSADPNLAADTSCRSHVPQAEVHRSGTTPPCLGGSINGSASGRNHNTQRTTQGEHSMARTRRPACSPVVHEHPYPASIQGDPSRMTDPLRRPRAGSPADAS